MGLGNERAEDEELIYELLEILQTKHVDYTRFFRRLSDFKKAVGEKNDSLQRMFVDPASFDGWAEKYKNRLTNENSVDEKRHGREYS